ncbi:hypothetical protein NDR87_06900 [Nocardia sp. CDC159]|uniref:Uncharacterized protein n=1 Tax=Nocardia pulmonis TaxID=2951408 RepID=A0A9X2IW97_9NOCA|nr:MULTISPECIES: hypothetical protein [Nocardia]MCM6772615.1 hypothetical protein [Nocardia pulmonis]MCM6786082.1 hypothetical protein [Nocardia sp. CDC159]
MEHGETRSLRALFAADLRRWIDNWQADQAARRDPGDRWSWVNSEWIGSVIGPASL